MRRCWAPSTLPAQSCLKVSSDPFDDRDFAEKLNLGFLQKKKKKTPPVCMFSGSLLGRMEKPSLHQPLQASLRKPNLLPHEHLEGGLPR